jgi:hypothetical protein
MHKRLHKEYECRKTAILKSLSRWKALDRVQCLRYSPL